MRGGRLGCRVDASIVLIQSSPARQHAVGAVHMHELLGQRCGLDVRGSMSMPTSSVTDVTFHTNHCVLLNLLRIGLTRDIIRQNLKIMYVRGNN